MDWTSQQSSALQAIEKWLKGGKKTPQVFRLFGWAGTGKTTIAKEVEGMVKAPVLFATPTGKAALVLRSKGCPDTSTVHSLIYRVEEQKDGPPKYRLNRDSRLATAGCLGLDECSMVGEEVGRDVLSFGTKVLVLGDPFQLPPVKDAGFFTEAAPDFMLTEIRRQAADNPIIRMSMDVREGRGLARGAYGDSRVISRDQLGQKTVLGADQILCGRNNSRRAYNDRIRALKGFQTAMPSVGDKVICLKNDRELNILNGGLFTVVESKLRSKVVCMKVRPEEGGDPIKVQVLEDFFLGRGEQLEYTKRRGFQEFDYGYAITVHKAQGSQWPRVVLFDESSVFREDAARWLYTGLTRAADQITIVN